MVDIFASKARHLLRSSSMLYDVEVFVLNDPEVMERIAEALERIAYVLGIQAGFDE